MKHSKIAALVINQSRSLMELKKKSKFISIKINKPIALSLLSFALLGISSSYALAATVDECNSAGSACIVVSNTAELKAVLESTNNQATKIVFANDITLTADVAVRMVESNRKNIVLDGNGYSLNVGLFDFNIEGTTPADWNSNKGSFTFQNFNNLLSSLASDQAVIRVGRNSAVDVIFDNINRFSDSMYAVMGVQGDSSAGNNLAEVVFGDIHSMDPFTYKVGHQIVQGGPLRFKGKFTIFTDGSLGTYNTVFWTNVENKYNIMNFESTADVSAQVTSFTLGSANNNNAYQYIMDDGAKFKLYTSTNTFGNSNNGLKLGTFDSANGFGEGVILNLGNYNGGALAGNSISNLGGDASGGMGNGAATNGDVIFNIGQGSQLNYSGANNAGIFVKKNTNVGGDIYIRSDAELNATNANGIIANLDGTGDLVLLNDANAIINSQIGIGLTSNANNSNYQIFNKGIINSKIDGINLALNNSSVANIDMTDGTVNATSGNGISVSGQGNTNITGGEINVLQGASLGLNIKSTGNTLVDQLVMTLSNTSGTAINKTGTGSLSISNSEFFADNNASIIKNAINIKLKDVVVNLSEMAVGIINTASNLATWQIDNLIINLANNSTGIELFGGGEFKDQIKINMDTNATGIGLKFLDGDNNELTLNDKFQFNSFGKTALSVSGDGNKIVNQISQIVGDILFDNLKNTQYNLSSELVGNINATQGTEHDLFINNSGNIQGDINFETGINTINLANETKITGNVSTSNSDDSLILDNATIQGTVSLGDGNNSIQLSGSSKLEKGINTGSGNDTFDLLHLTQNTSIGSINAGAGLNTLNLSTSVYSSYQLGLENKWQGITVANILADTTLSLNDLNAATSTQFILDDSATLLINSNNSLPAVLQNKVSGSGRVDLRGQIDITNANTDFTGEWKLEESGKIHTNLVDAFGNASIINNGLINLDGINQFNNAMSGNGIFAINNADSFDFGTNFGSQFSGQIAFFNSNVNFDESTKDAFANSDVLMGNGSTGAIKADQTIGDLTLNGGTLTFSLDAPTNSPILSVTNLNIDHLNNTNLDIKGLINLDLSQIQPGAPSSNLLDINSSLSDNAIKLISAKNISIGNKQLNLTVNGDQVTNGIQIDNLDDGFGNLISAIYDYVAVSALDENNSRGAGIYIDVLIKELISNSNIIFNNSDSLNNTISTLISGNGGIEINASGDAPITLTNENNRYTGKTTVSQGQLNLGGDNVLGQTSELAINTDASVDMLDANIDLALLTGKGDLNVNTGHLKLSQGDFLGVLSGGEDAKLDINGDVTLSGNNTFTGATTISTKGSLTIGNGVNNGSFVGNITNNGSVLFNQNSDASYEGKISGTGIFNKLGAGNLTLLNNQSFTGKTTIQDGSLTLSGEGNLSGEVVNNSFFNINKETDYQFDHLISGTGVVNIDGAGETLFLKSNTYVGGTNINAGSLVLGSSDSAGTGGITNNSLLSLRFDNANLVNNLSGNGLVNIQGTNIGLADNSLFSGEFNITFPYSLNINSLEQLGSAKVTVNGLLNLGFDTPNLNLANKLSGNGLISLDTQGGELKFTNSNLASDFAGVFVLNNTNFSLDDVINLNNIQNTTLSIREGSSLSSSYETQIKNLDVQNGQLNLTMKSPTEANLLHVDTLSIDNQNGRGSVNLEGATLNLPTVNRESSLLDQNTFDPTTSFMVVQADNVATPGQFLTLKIDDQALESVNAMIKDDAGNNINASYNYIGIAADSSINKNVTKNGLYVTYLLTEIETLTDLVIDSGLSSFNQFVAKITGNGNVILKSNPNQELIISNSENDYLGTTTITNGVVKLGANQALSEANTVNITSDGTLDLASKIQDISALNIESTGTLNFNNGVINLLGNESSEIFGTLVGSGVLNINAGVLNINSQNDLFNAMLNIKTGAAIALNNNSTLGQGDLKLEDNASLNLNKATSLIRNNLSGTGNINLIQSSAVLGGNSADFLGTFNIDNDSDLSVTNLNNLGLASINNLGVLNFNLIDLDQTLTSSIDGSGQFNKLGNGILRINSDYSHIDTFNAKEGSLLLDSASAKIKNLDISEDGIAGGIGLIEGTVTNNGIFVVGDSSGLIDETGLTLTINGDLLNYNIVTFAGMNAGNKLNVLGNYDARSDLIFNTVLGDDTSITDKLAIKGDTQGNTQVYVMNKGGKGAQTQNGIELITVEGDSSGTFELANRVVAGSYDYQLVKEGGNWLLKSNLMGLRPEIGAYLANLDIANASMSSRFSDRIDNISKSKSGRVWGKMSGSITDSRAADEINQTLYSSYLQLGSDLLKFESNKGQTTFGLTGAIGTAHSRNVSEKTGLIANTNQDNYRLGVYANYQFDANSNHNKAYIDSLTQYAWFSNEVKGQDLDSNHLYDANALSTAIEFGWPITLSESANYYVDLIPQAQLTYKYLTADSFMEDNGTQIHHKNSSLLETRLGGDLKFQTFRTTDMPITGYVGLNWIHEGNNNSVDFDNTRYYSNKPADIIDVKLGMKVDWAPDLSTFLQIDSQQGQNSYNNLKASMGLSYQF